MTSQVIFHSLLVVEGKDVGTSCQQGEEAQKEGLHRGGKHRAGSAGRTELQTERTNKSEE